MSEPIDASERRQLCELMLELGPDAPTLCEGWATADLAAHLVLREHFRRWPPERIAVEKSKGFQVLVTRLQAGAPLVPWRLPRVRTFLNGVEYFIHHEDVRRANGRGPRTGIDDIDDLAWRVVGLQARQFARRVVPSASNSFVPMTCGGSMARGRWHCSVAVPPSSFSSCPAGVRGFR